MLKFDLQHPPIRIDLTLCDTHVFLTYSVYLYIIVLEFVW